MKYIEGLLTLAVVLWLLFRASRRDNTDTLKRATELRYKRETQRNLDVKAFRAQLLNDFRAAHALSVYAEVAPYLTMLKSAKPLEKEYWLTPEILERVYGIEAKPEPAPENNNIPSGEK